MAGTFTHASGAPLHTTTGGTVRPIQSSAVPMSVRELIGHRETFSYLDNSAYIAHCMTCPVAGCTNRKGPLATDCGQHR